MLSLLELRCITTEGLILKKKAKKLKQLRQGLQYHDLHLDRKYFLLSRQIEDYLDSYKMIKKNIVSQRYREKIRKIVNILGNHYEDLMNIFEN